MDSRRILGLTFKDKATIKTVLKFDKPVHLPRVAHSAKSVRAEKMSQVAKSHRNEVDLGVVGLDAGEANKKLMKISFAPSPKSTWFNSASLPVEFHCISSILVI